MTENQERAVKEIVRAEGGEVSSCRICGGSKKVPTGIKALDSRVTYEECQACDSSATRDIEKGFFTAEDLAKPWAPVPYDREQMEKIADRANALLRDWLKEQQQSFGLVKGDGRHVGGWGRKPFENDTHTGFLIGIKLRKECP